MKHEPIKDNVFIHIDSTGNETIKIDDQNVMLWNIIKKNDADNIVNKFKAGSIWMHKEDKSSLLIKDVDLRIIKDVSPTKATVTITGVDFPLSKDCYAKFILDSGDLLENYKKFPACSQCGSIEVTLTRDQIEITDCSDHTRRFMPCDHYDQVCRECDYTETLPIPRTIVEEIIELYRKLTGEELDKLLIAVQPVINNILIRECKHENLSNGNCQFCMKEFEVTLTEIKEEDKYDAYD